MVTEASCIKAIEAGLQALGERDDGGLGVVGEEPAGLLVKGQGTHGHVLAAAEAELGEVVVDGVGELDRHGVVDDGIRSAGLVRPHVQCQQCGLGYAGQGGFVPAGLSHQTDPIRP